MKFKIEHLQDNTYQVLILDNNCNYYPAFQGSLANCEAYLQLKVLSDQGKIDMNF